MEEGTAASSRAAPRGGEQQTVVAADVRGSVAARVFARPRAAARRLECSASETICGYGAGAATWTLLLGGTWRAAAASGVAAALSGGLSGLAGRKVATPAALTAVLVGVSVALSQRLWGPFSVEAACMAALLPRLPWRPLVIGVEEVVSRNLLAAGARLLTAMLTFLQLAFGLALGTRLILQGAPSPVVASVGISALEHTSALLIALRVLCLQRQVASADLPWVFAAGIVGYASARLSSERLGVELGAFCAAFMVGALANTVAGWCERPARVLAVPGMFALWPGALGLRGANSLWTGAPMGGVQQGLSVAMMALGAVTGLLVAAHLVPSKRALSD